MVLVEFLKQFMYVILIGALIGVEREHARKLHKTRDVPIFGLRTTIIFAILGFFFAYFSKIINSNLLIVFGAVAALVIVTVVYISNVWVKRHTGSTTYITMLIVFFLGALIGLGEQTYFIIASVIAIIVTLFLATKRILVSWSRKLTNKEIFAALKFGIIAFIILPLLPNQFIDPWGVINPQQIWYIVVLISLVYFVSYILMKEFSHKGLLLSSLFGGLINGSATVYQIGDWVKQKIGLLKHAASGVFLACFTGILSDIIVIGFVFANFKLLSYTIFAQIAGMIALIVMAFFLYKEIKAKKQPELKLKSPFAFKPALVFAGFYIGLLLLGAVIKLYFGETAILPVVAAGSLYSSSAVIASLTGLSGLGTLSTITAAKFVILASIISLLIKTFWVYKSENKRLLKIVFAGTVITSVVMAATLWMQLLI